MDVKIISFILITRLSKMPKTLIVHVCIILKLGGGLPTLGQGVEKRVELEPLDLKLSHS